MAAVRLESRALKDIGQARDIAMEQTAASEWPRSDTVFLSTSCRFWWRFETEILRGGEPWVKCAARGSFSLNGKDYHMTQTNIFMPDWGLVRDGKTILEVKKRSIFSSLYDFNYAEKRWTIVNKMGTFSRKVMIECGGQAAGGIRKSWTKFEAWLPTELPDEIKVMLIWIAKTMYARATSVS
jgi:hypothetical protein